MDRTLKDLAVEALAVQDACNLSGVAQGFARAMLDLRRLPEGDGTDRCARHPITIVWLDKLNSLAGIQTETGTPGPVWHAFEAVEKIAKAEG